MAYKIIRERKYYDPSKREITAVLDSASDIDTLQQNEENLAPGSIAIIADADLPCYVLNASGVWKSV